MDAKPKGDYSLYLVTDNTKAILGDKNIVDVVRAAVEGGVTIVQLRDKTSETADLIRTAKELHRITKEHGVPLIINDRADVALAVGAEGLHIGQDDMDLATARRLLGPNAIIGVTASSEEEALKAAEGGADYLGVGTVYATPTKENAKSIIGPPGVRSILETLSSPSKPHPTIPTVLIGGINASNLQRILYQSTPNAPANPPSGIAVVSALMSSPDPAKTAKHLLTLLRTPPPFASPNKPLSSLLTSPEDLTPLIPSILRRVATQKPLAHNITNTVVQNLAANIALSLGASPIMSANGHEAADLAALHGSLLLNMGTVTPDALAHYTMAIQAYNAVGGPIVLDPVGAGATAARRDAVRKLLATGYFSVIKGNEAEITTVLASTYPLSSTIKQPSSETQQQRGVDSAPTSLSPNALATLAKTLALRTRSTVLLTGAIDYLSDGYRTYSISNGHHYLGLITGAGCTLGTTIAAFCAVEREDVLLAVLGAAVVFEIAAERAGSREDVGGPGTFTPRFIDELFSLRSSVEEEGEEVGWISSAKVSVIDI